MDAEHASDSSEVAAKAAIINNMSGSEAQRC
jgi:hypothetical protein